MSSPKTKLSTCLALMLGLVVGAAHADIITFRPSDADLADLDHDWAYRWSINASSLTGKTITGATLFIDNIRDWTIESNDVLYVQLMNTYVSTSTGIRRYWDDEANTNYFGGSGLNLETYRDLLPYTRAELVNKTSVDLTYTFTAVELARLTTYLADGKFSLGFDPDCHYYNDGVKLTLHTAPAVPEPGTFALLGLGLLALAVMRRRKSA